MNVARLSIGVAVAGWMAVSAGSAETNKLVIPQAQQDAGCPVTMAAQHASGLSTQIMVGAKDKQPVRRQGQHLQLQLTNAKTSEITSLRLAVRGWSGKGATLQTQDVSADRMDVSKVIEVRVNLGPRASGNTDVWVNGLTSVDSIDLVGVTYAGGLSWRPQAGQMCSIVPDPTTLISER